MLKVYEVLTVALNEDLHFLGYEMLPLDSSPSKSILIHG
jgi:hypothetical protein